MTPYEIPLSPEPQSFTANLAGRELRLRVQWNKASRAWTLDIREVDDTPILLGVPVVTGHDLLGQHRHLGLGGSLVAQTDFDPLAVPTFENLGVQGRLFFLAD